MTTQVRKTKDIEIHVQGDTVYGFFYRGTISNFYRESFELSTSLLDGLAFKANTEEERDQIFVLERIFNAIQAIDPNKVVTFTCGEQFIMACKAMLCNDVVVYNEIMTPYLKSYEYKGLGRKVSNFKVHESEWNSLRPIVSAYIIHARMNNPSSRLATALAVVNDYWNSETPNLVMVETSPTDRIWGVGLDEEQCATKLQYEGNVKFNRFVGTRVFTLGFDLALRG